MSQASLRDLWMGGQRDRLSPGMQSMALAYRQASKELTESKKPNIAWVARHVKRVDGQQPTKQSLHEFFTKVDRDRDWYPGKHTGAKRGPAPVFTPAKRHAVAKCAMRIKARGDEPTAEEVLQRCPASTTNPDTGKAFDLKLIRKVFCTECYDLDPENPWRFQRREKKTYLPQQVVEHRLDMCTKLLAMESLSAAWFFNNVVWIDPCSSIIPGSYKQWARMKQALKGEKGWVSDDAKGKNRNRRGPKTALSQTTWEGSKMNWVIILSRGVIGVDILPLDWELDSEGMAVVVRRLSGRLREMLGNDARLPRTLMTDRGTGMYAPSGRVTGAYDCAVRECGFKLFWGPDAKQQSPEMPDLLLHETAVSWVRNKLRRAKPETMPWKETPAQWSRRMMAAVGEANLGDVDGLCRQFPERLEECVAAGGNKLDY